MSLESILHYSENRGNIEQNTPSTKRTLSNLHKDHLNVDNATSELKQL